MFLTFTPPIKTFPDCGSKNLDIIAASVDLPPPEGPTNAAFSPLLILREISFNAFFSPL